MSVLNRSSFMKGLQKLPALVMFALMLNVGVAWASELGGLHSTQIGADAAPVVSCQVGGVNLAFQPVFQAGEYHVGAVTVGNLAEECRGMTVWVEVFGPDGELAGYGEGKAEGAEVVVPLEASEPSVGVPAHTVGGVGVVITVK